MAPQRYPAFILGLLFGSVVLVNPPIVVIGWTVAAVALWRAPRWRAWEKAVGMLLLPGGFFAISVAYLGESPRVP